MLANDRSIALLVELRDNNDVNWNVLCIGKEALNECWTIAMLMTAATRTKTAPKTLFSFRSFCSCVAFVDDVVQFRANIFRLTVFFWFVDVRSFSNCDDESIRHRWWWWWDTKSLKMNWKMCEIEMANRRWIAIELNWRVKNDQIVASVRFVSVFQLNRFDVCSHEWINFDVQQFFSFIFVFSFFFFVFQTYGLFEQSFCIEIYWRVKWFTHLKERKTKGEHKPSDETNVKTRKYEQWK